MNFLNLFKKKLIDKGIPEDKVNIIVNKVNIVQTNYVEDLINQINFMIDNEVDNHFLNLNDDKRKKLKSQRNMKVALELYTQVIKNTPEFLGELKNQLEFILKAINSDLERKQ